MQTVDVAPCPCLATVPPGTLLIPVSMLICGRSADCVGHSQLQVLLEALTTLKSDYEEGPVNYEPNHVHTLVTLNDLIDIVTDTMAEQLAEFAYQQAPAA